MDARTHRLAALTTERMSWEDWKKVEKEKAAKEAMVAAEEESQMLEYRKQLDQDRNALLAKGRNNAHLRVQACFCLSLLLPLAPVLYSACYGWIM